MSTLPEGEGSSGAQRIANALYRFSFWLPLGVCTYLALAPNPPEHPVFQLGDVILHAAAFTYLTLALMFASATSRPWHARSWWVRAARTFAWMLAYGLLLEFVQSFVPERDAELKDLAVDALGILAGLLIARLMVDPVRSLVGRLLDGLLNGRSRTGV